MFVKNKDVNLIISMIEDIKKYHSYHNTELRNIDDRLERLVSSISKLQKTVDSQLNIVESQQRTIEALTNALCDKYAEGLFIFSEDGKIPTVIRNGKELTDDLTQEFYINWTIGEFPNISIEQIAGTHKDLNV